MLKMQWVGIWHSLIIKICVCRQAGATIHIGLGIIRCIILLFIENFVLVRCGTDSYFLSSVLSSNKCLSNVIFGTRKVLMLLQY